MPAAAVIPAPIAYIKVVAVKKLVAGFLVNHRCFLYRPQEKIVQFIATSHSMSGLAAILLL